MKIIRKEIIIKFIGFPILVIISLIIEKSIENKSWFMILVKIFNLMLENLTLIVSILSAIGIVIMIIYMKLKDILKNTDDKIDEINFALYNHSINILHLYSMNESNNVANVKTDLLKERFTKDELKMLNYYPDIIKKVKPLSKETKEKIKKLIKDEYNTDKQ